LRTQLKGPLGNNDLANSMSSPYAVTLPKLLARQGYESGLFGKYHIALRNNNSAGYGVVRAGGWNHFAGWLDETGDPSSIDSTAGGVGAPGTFTCGFVPGRLADPLNGADTGACYSANGACAMLGTSRGVPPGRQCVMQGGLLDPNAACQSPAPSRLKFSTLQSHYVSPVVYDRADDSLEVLAPTDPRARRWRSTFAVDQAVEWIRSRPAGKPWMATVSFSTVHTPLVPPPVDGSLRGNLAASGLNCNDSCSARTRT
jgi:Sulfatase